MQYVYKTSLFLPLFIQAFVCLSASKLSDCHLSEKIQLENVDRNCSCATGSLNTSSISELKIHSTKTAVDDRRVVDRILMHGFVGEMHLDTQKMPTDSLRPLNINIDAETRNISGSFFNFFDHKPTFKLDAEDQRRVTLSGGPLTAPYIMDQFHFHVYCTRKEAVESTLDRTQVPGELHLVFFREKYESYSEAIHRYNDGLAVVAIYLEVGDEKRSDPQIANFSSLVDHISQDENRQLSATASIKQLTEPVDKNNAEYDAYRGKLVEPIKCKNCVDVFVMRERFSMSVKQMTEFRKAPHCVENDWAF